MTTGAALVALDWIHLTDPTTPLIAAPWVHRPPFLFDIFFDMSFDRLCDRFLVDMGGQHEPQNPSKIHSKCLQNRCPTKPAFFH